MVDEPDNLVLRMLEQIRSQNSRILEKIERLADDVLDLKVRMTAVEEGLVGVHRRLDRLEARVERIERRLDLVDTH